MACIFGHKWDGCKCTKCGQTRDESHNVKNGTCVICNKHFVTMSSFTSEEIILLGVAMGTLSGLLKEQGNATPQFDRLSSMFKDSLADTSNKWISQEDMQFINAASAMYLEAIGLQNLSPKEEQLWLSLVDKYSRLVN